MYKFAIIGCGKIAHRHAENILRTGKLAAVCDMAEGKKPNDYMMYRGSMSHHKEVYEQLSAALRSENHSFTNALDGLKTVEIIEKIYKAVSSPIPVAS